MQNLSHKHGETNEQAKNNQCSTILSSQAKYANLRIVCFAQSISSFSFKSLMCEWI
jgi:hypothetical protein